MITQKRLKELLHYNPDTGIFTWLSAGQGRAIGRKAGGNNGGGYIRISINGNRYMAHRLAWLYEHNEWPEGEIDHINHNHSDNRIINIRAVSSADNTKNRPLNCNSASGICGVYWYKRSSKWVAQIGINGKVRTIGYYLSKAAAVAARKAIELEHGFHQNHGKAHEEANLT